MALISKGSSGEIMSEILVIAILVMVFNVLDSATTHLGFKQYPEKDLKSEANPTMRWLMLKNKWLAEIFKQVGVLAIVVFLFLNNEIWSMRVVGIMLGLVVLNNTYVIVSRAIMRKKVISPVKALQRFCHIPERLVYFVAVLIIIVWTYMINGIVWGFEYYS